MGQRTTLKSHRQTCLKGILGLKGTLALFAGLSGQGGSRARKGAGGVCFGKERMCQTQGYHPETRFSKGGLPRDSVGTVGRKKESPHRLSNMPLQYPTRLLLQSIVKTIGMRAIRFPFALREKAVTTKGRTQPRSKFRVRADLRQICVDTKLIQNLALLWKSRQETPKAGKSNWSSRRG